MLPYPLGLTRERADSLMQKSSLKKSKSIEVGDLTTENSKARLLLWAGMPVCLWKFQTPDDNPGRLASGTLQQTSSHSVICEACSKSHVWMLLRDGKIGATDELKKKEEEEEALRGFIIMSKHHIKANAYINKC